MATGETVVSSDSGDLDRMTGKVLHSRLIGKVALFPPNCFGQDGQLEEKIGKGPVHRKRPFDGRENQAHYPRRNGCFVHGCSPSADAH